MLVGSGFDFSLFLWLFKMLTGYYHIKHALWLRKLFPEFHRPKWLWMKLYDTDNNRSIKVKKI